MHRLQVLITHAIFISLCALALTGQTYQWIGLPLNGYVLALVFLGTCCSYNLYRLISLFPFHSKDAWRCFLRDHITSLSLMVLTGSGMIILLLEERLLVVPSILATAGTILYCLPLLPVEKPTWFVKLGVMKTILLSATWTFVTGCLPLISSGQSLSASNWYFVGCRLTFMLILCIIFDKRDMEKDQLRALGSIATSIRPVYLQWITIILFVLHGLFILAMAGTAGKQAFAMALAFTAVLTVFFYQWAGRTKNDWFYYFGVDGLMLISALSTFLTTN